MNDVLMATQAAAGLGAGNGGMISFIVQIVLLVAVAWFFIFRPQQQRAKAHRAKLDAVKRGDTVVTGGGLVAKVSKVADDHVELELAPNVKVKAVKATLADVLQPGDMAAND